MKDADAYEACGDHADTDPACVRCGHGLTIYEWAGSRAAALMRWTEIPATDREHVILGILHAKAEAPDKRAKDYDAAIALLRSAYR